MSVVASLGSPERKSLDDQFIASVMSKHPAVQVQNAAAKVSQLRAFKTAPELALIKRATAVTVDAHAEAAKAVRPKGNEYEVDAVVSYTFRRNGAERSSFASIVGSGPNATTLHYNANDRQMQPGEVVVVDIGASVEGYSADMTRTYPVNGTFSAEQRAVYQVVRDAQAAAERQAKIGARANLMSDSASAALAAGLAKIGLIESPTATYDCSADGSRKCSQLSLYYMHGLGHGIGLEVHDPDRYYLEGVLGDGSVFTLEPGIYVRENLLDILPKTSRNAQLAAKLRPVLERYRNVGVRIEDDYVVTSKGLEWITRSPREIAEIEALMARRM
jgi:Xaa-Pro aminopeptidase